MEIWCPEGWRLRDLTLGARERPSSPNPSSRNHQVAVPTRIPPRPIATSPRLGDALLPELAPGPAKTASIIMRRESARIGVLATGVIAANQRVSVGQRRNRVVSELRLWPEHVSGLFHELQVRVEANVSERDDHADVAVRQSRPAWVRQAARKLLGRRLVVGWEAANGGRNIRIRQHQPIVYRTL